MRYFAIAKSLISAFSHYAAALLRISSAWCYHKCQVPPFSRAMPHSLDTSRRRVLTLMMPALLRETLAMMPYEMRII